MEVDWIADVFGGNLVRIGAGIFCTGISDSHIYLFHSDKNRFCCCILGSWSGIIFPWRPVSFREYFVFVVKPLYQKGWQVFNFHLSLQCAGVKSEKIYENAEVLWEQVFPKSKRQPAFFNKINPIIEVCTYNTSLKNHLSEYAAKYPTEFRLVDDDENGCLTFEIRKGAVQFQAKRSIQRRVPESGQWAG